MATLASLVVNLEANTAKYQSSMKRSGKAMDVLKNKAVQLGGVIAAAFTIRAVTRFATESVKAFTVQQDAVEGLRAALVVTGRDGENALQRLTAKASELQRLTRKGDEEIIGALTTVTQLAQGLDVSALEDVQSAIIGIAETFTSGNLESAAQLVGKTIGSTTNALTRYGIQVDTAATQQEKLSQIVAQSSTFFDVAKARADTLAGRMAQLTNAWGDLKEAIGQVIAGSPAVKAFLEQTTQIVSKITTIISAGGPFIRDGFAILGDIAAQSFVVAFSKAFVAFADTGIGKAIIGPLSGLNFVVKDAEESIVQGLAVIEDRFQDFNELAERAADSSSKLAEALSGSGGGGGGGAPSVAGALTEAKAAAIAAGKAFKEILPNRSDRLLDFMERLRAQKGLKRGVVGTNRPSADLRLPEIRDGLKSVERIVTGSVDTLRENIKASAIGIGEDFIGGLIRGMDNLRDFLRNSVNELASIVLIGGLKKLLKIASPSQVAVGIGERVAEGLAIGVAGGRRMVSAAAGTAVSGLSGASGGGSGGGSPMIGQLTVQMSVAAVDARGVHELLFNNRGAIAESFATALTENSSLRALMRQV